MKRTFAFLAVATTLLLSACASDHDMREQFGDNRVHIMVDQKDGRRYAVQHSFGDNYSVRPLDKVLY